jgi:DNA helicase-4
MRIGDRVIDLENRSLGIGSITEMRSASRAIVSFGLHHYLVPLSSLAYVEDAERILKMQKEKETELHQEALDRKRIQEEKRGKQVQEELSRRRIQTEQRENQRKLFFDEIRRRFHTDFLCSDSYYCETCADLMQKEEYEKEKLSFVKTWLSENLPHDKNGEIQLPDDEQVAAIAAVNGHIQVVARAGSGKTTTLVTRAFFLLKHCRVLPSELLLLAFNRKAALEIRRRLLSLLHKDAELEVLKEVDRRVRATEKKKRIDRDAIEASAVDAVAVNFNVELPHVMTFHALAYAIVHPVESLLYDGAEGESQGLSRVIQQVIDDHLKLPDAREQIRELMLAHFREEWDCIVEGCYDRSKEEFLQYRRSLPRESLRGDFVKSSGEKIIADFLFEHDIAYKYERNHWWSGINYRPDFTIFKGPESGVVIEYFGLKGDEDYDEMTEKKRGYWATKKDWTLIEFEPVDIARDGRHSFLDRLNKRLKAEGVECIRLSEC